MWRHNQCQVGWVTFCWRGRLVPGVVSARKVREARAVCQVCMQFTFVSVDVLEKDPTHQGCMGETDSQTKAVRDTGHETSLEGTERSRSEVCGGQGEGWRVSRSTHTSHRDKACLCGPPPLTRSAAACALNATPKPHILLSNIYALKVTYVCHLRTIKAYHEGGFMHLSQECAQWYQEGSLKAVPARVFMKISYYYKTSLVLISCFIDCLDLKRNGEKVNNRDQT